MHVLKQSITHRKGSEYGLAILYAATLLMVFLDDDM